MKQFQIPQFITVEDKVIGPFTIKQFLYLGSGALLIVFAYMFLLSYIFVPLAIFIGALSASLAFLKINEQPFPTILKNAVFFVLRPRLYLWKQEDMKKAGAKEGGQKKEKKQEVLINSIPKLSTSKLSDLAWSLDIKEWLSELGEK